MIMIFQETFENECIHKNMNPQLGLCSCAFCKFVITDSNTACRCFIIQQKGEQRAIFEIIDISHIFHLGNFMLQNNKY